MTVAEKLLQIANNEPKVFEAGEAKGRAAERNEFWGIFQDGKALNTTYGGYLYAFAYFGWSDENYNPIKDIVSNNCASMYFFAKDLTDTKVPIIANNANCNNMFAQSGIKRIPYVEFNNCQSFSNTFNMTPLEYIRVGGEIDKSIDFSTCPLDFESAKSVIMHLKNFMGTDEAWTNTVYFSEYTWNELNADTETLWIKYISDNIGWNC